MSYHTPSGFKMPPAWLGFVVIMAVFFLGIGVSFVLSPSQPEKSTKNRTGLVTGEGLTKSTKETRYEIVIPQNRKEEAAKLYAEVFKSSMENDRGHYAERDAKAAVERVYGERTEIKE